MPVARRAAVDEVLALRGVGQHAVDVEHDRGARGRPGPRATPVVGDVNGRRRVCSVFLGCRRGAGRLISSTTAGVGQRGGVAEVAALGDVAQQAAHDLAAAGLGQVVGEDDGLGPGDGARSCCATCCRQLLAVLRRRLVARPCSVTKATIAWPVVSSLAPTTAASATAGWSTSADSTSVVEMRWPDTFITSSTRPEQPEVAVVVDLGAVAGEVAALEPAPVRLVVALGVAVDAAQHRRPRLGEREVAAAAPLDRLARASSTTSAPMPGSGKVAEPGLSMVSARERARS